MIFGLMWFILKVNRLIEGDGSAGLMIMAATEMAAELGIFAVWLNGG